ncbi:HAD-IIA family hydrolase [Victivallis sp. Marseille-Q1083]|uniref:HAD-IIA family hydrolase n=1 Tax=Victivallis sp. Marseille-Q1083 TaxID=2717288 RepID=UPI00158B2B86|nr:HAD hydrolase-like protein [Victivallis sp. Marseille-Q1083]
MKFLDFWVKNQERYQALLFDIDGTLIAGRHLMPGADQMLRWLRENRYPFFLLTNDGNHSTLEKSMLLASNGLKIAPEEILSCADALVEVVEERRLHDQKFFILGDLGNPCYAFRAGLQPTRELAELDSCTGVICGEGRYDWYDHIQAVFNFFRRHPDRLFIVPNPDGCWPGAPNGDFGIGAGGVARFIASLLAEMNLDIPIHYLGKPYPAIYDYALHRLRQKFQLQLNDRRRVMMLGDSLLSDIRGANWSGLESGLLLTGITSPELAAAATAEFKPNLQFESFI